MAKLSRRERKLLNESKSMIVVKYAKSIGAKVINLKPVKPKIKDYMGLPSAPGFNRF